MAGLGWRIGAAGKRWTAATFSIRRLLDAPVECLPHNLGGTEYTPMQAKRRSPNLATQKKEPKLSRSHAPADLSPVEWQRGLRRQFGREQAFGLENLTSEPFFSEFRVSNPTSKSSYRVAIRSMGPWWQFLLMPRLCDERAWHLQAHRVHACATGEEARRQSRVCARLPASFFGTVSPQRRQAPHPFPGWNRLPASVARGRRGIVRCRS